MMKLGIFLTARDDHTRVESLPSVAASPCVVVIPRQALALRPSLAFRLLRRSYHANLSLQNFGTRESRG